MSPSLGLEHTVSLYKNVLWKYRTQIWHNGFDRNWKFALAHNRFVKGATLPNLL